MQIKVIMFGLVIFFSSREGKTQNDSIVHSPSMSTHLKVVNSKYYYKIPQITESDFCDKLKSIKIPNEKYFNDSTSGNEISYFLQFSLEFSKKNNIPSICFRSDTSKSKFNVSISSNIYELLKKTTWKNEYSSRGHLIYFSCTVTKNGIREVFISSSDYLNSSEICTD